MTSLYEYMIWPPLTLIFYYYNPLPSGKLFRRSNCLNEVAKNAVPDQVPPFQAGVWSETSPFAMQISLIIEVSENINYYPYKKKFVKIFILHLFAEDSFKFGAKIVKIPQWGYMFLILAGSYSRNSIVQIPITRIPV